MTELADLVHAFCEKKRIWNWSGRRGIESLRSLLEALGYEDEPLVKDGDPISQFLEDNPDAVEAIVDWIKDGHCVDWGRNLREAIREA